MSFLVEGIAVGDGEHAVKIQVIRPDEPTLDEQQKMCARATAQYRLEFGEWPPNAPRCEYKRWR